MNTPMKRRAMGVLERTGSITGAWEKWICATWQYLKPGKKGPKAEKFRVVNGIRSFNVKQEWLAMRIENNGDHTYALSNAPENAALPFLADLLCVREMLRAVMPLPQLSPEEAQAQIIKHLVNRSRSTASRLRKWRKTDILT
jgi:hypothetical protein